MSYRLGFIGAGNMAEAIVQGALRAGVLPAAAISAADPSDARRALFRDQFAIAVFPDNNSVADRSDVLILAVKPQALDAVLANLRPHLRPDHLLVSIAAGVTLARLARLCHSPSAAAPRIIRAMPNTPLLVGHGLVALSRAASATDADLARVRDLFAAGATVLEVPEEKMDAVTAVSGSGPAYFFFLVESLAAAGIEAGLSPDEAALLAATTFVGSAQLLAQQNLDPAELRRRVTSPGGTTAAALDSFTKSSFPAIVAQAVRAAADRSRELGRNI
jgi:pyrroline-5-carboxylate reductase